MTNCHSGLLFWATLYNRTQQPAYIVVSSMLSLLIVNEKKTVADVRHYFFFVSGA